ncbi:MAG: hypothetical protein IT209_00445 [Armatimonadetes bacterium]|nr:hypothetical protein [Armatimonadota bacterium]
MSKTLLSLLPLLPCVFLGALGQLLIKQGVQSIKSAAGHDLTIGMMLSHPTLVVFNWAIVGGFVAYGLSSAFWLTLASKFPLTYIYPMVALTYVLVVLASVVFNREPANLFTWLSLGLIVAGVSLLAGAGGK